jgi:hypothetical protein
MAGDMLCVPLVPVESEHVLPSALSIHTEYVFGQASGEARNWFSRRISHRDPGPSAGRSS